ncbi:MAG: hypothetical protein U0638_06080 [Phycisphaerales bacterium]
MFAGVSLIVTGCVRWPTNTESDSNPAPTDQNAQPRYLAPNLAKLPDGTLEASFDLPSNSSGRVDWLLVRDWLVSEFSATFLRAYEYPTFEWSAEFAATFNGQTVHALLWWSDFPDELTISANACNDNEFIRHIHARMPEMKVSLGDLSTMSVRTWRDWMQSLGSPRFEQAPKREWPTPPHHECNNPP